jgi:TPR repeat protein|mmetsp:Transcript_13376/g.19520  ORF Transcript_13376/g.19520 Transcript_13376/m.19520 type:complete len:293 (+) Transcript_13376:189-1067(+)
MLRPGAFQSMLGVVSIFCVTACQLAAQSEAQNEISDAEVAVSSSRSDGGVSEAIKLPQADEFQQLLQEANAGSAEASYEVADRYSKGSGFADNEEKAFEYYKKAADQGLAKAQLAVGYSYDFGKGVEVNHEEAVKWYSLAARPASSNAQYRLGVMYQTGVGVEKDMNEAIRWLSLAADSKFPYAYPRLGDIYRDSEGAFSAPSKAQEMYLRGAVGGEQYSQVKLGLLYEEGIGVQQSNDNAFIWYKVAELLGSPSGKQNAEIISADMDSSKLDDLVSEAQLCIETKYSACPN